MAINDPEHREEDTAAPEDEDTGAQVAPIVRLEAVAVTTGEEDEHAILDLKAKLYRFDKDGNQWKERGAGAVKLVLPTISVQEHSGNDKSCLWHAAYFSNGQLKDELFCIRFASVDNCKKFMETVEEVAGSQKEKEENRDASNAAGLLEKLTVEDKEKKKDGDEMKEITESPKEEKEPEKVAAESESKEQEPPAPSST